KAQRIARCESTEHFVAFFQAIQRQIAGSDEQDALMLISEEVRLRMERASKRVNPAHQVIPIDTPQPPLLANWQITPSLCQLSSINEQRGIKRRLAESRKPVLIEEPVLEFEARPPEHAPAALKVRARPYTHPSTSSTSARPASVR